MNLYETTGKRFLDLLVAGLGAVALAPVHAFCAIAIYVHDGRPVYFTQARAGKDGKLFQLIKFRTMAVGTHEVSGGYPTPTMVTPVGQLLRKWSLDEIPQLLNVVKGDMSLVGPRPALPDQVTRYSPSQRGRLAVRPGLTGLAQVRYRNRAPWSVRIESDIEYIAAISLWTDLQIALRSVPAVILGAGVMSGQTVEQVDDLGKGEVSR